MKGCRDSIVGVDLYTTNLSHTLSHIPTTFTPLRSEATPTAGERYDPLTLQEMMEKVVLLRKAVETERKSYDQTNSKVLNSKMWQYASLLASQGSLGTAYKYLTQDGDVSGLKYFHTFFVGVA